ncbi:MAG: DUF362 domain-containing protein [Planctomycetes bacterium]|nr:DUF362 domain-containing protein [Planctomycetota bacterium]
MVLLDRRLVLKAAGAAAVGGLLPGSAVRLFAGERGPRVSIVTSGQYAGKSADVPDDVTARLVNRAVTSAVSAKDAASAWKSLFKPDDKVAVKINTLAGGKLSSHPGVVAAVVEGVLTAGVAPGAVIVFDRLERELRRAHFPVGTIRSGVRYSATDTPTIGYSRKLQTAGAVGSLFSRVITGFATAIVNVPVLKDHDLAGVTLGMKNFFGVIHNPNKYHDDGCDPFIADLSTSPLIRKRLRLVVVDALLAQADGGPAYRADGAFPYAGIIAGTDPVATDRVGWAEIEVLRAKMGFKALQAVGRLPRHILTAGKKGLGISDIDRIEVVRQTL